MFSVIKSNERGLLIKEGRFERLLMPGKHFTGAKELEIHDLKWFFNPAIDLSVLLENKELAEQLFVFTVNDDQLGIVLRDGKFLCVLPSAGKYALWKGPWQDELMCIDLSEPQITDKKIIQWIRNGSLNGVYENYTVHSHEIGLLYIDREFKGSLKPGEYYFLKRSKPVQVVTADTRLQNIELSGQEMLTKDKVSLRMNVSVVFKVIDAVKAVNSVNNYMSMLYSEMQLALRGYIGSISLEDVLNKKDDIAKYIITGTKEKCDAMGLAVSYAGVKDIILPGDVKDIINQVLIAEKKAQANIITRREETAGMRNMLNTAKLMEDNKMLYRLKEMEHLEKLAESVGTLEISSASGIVEQLKTLSGGKTAE